MEANAGSSRALAHIGSGLIAYAKTPRSFGPSPDAIVFHCQVERGYFLAPEGDSTKAYLLLAAILEKTQRAGIATFVMRGKEYLIAITAEHGILRAETMRFKDEIRSPAEIGLPAKIAPSAQQIRHFEQIIGKKSAKELSRDELHDETSAALLKIVKAKQAQKENVILRDEGKGEEEPALLADLKKSLAGRHHGRPRRRTPPASHGSRRAR